MANYKDIHGTNIETVASDPDNPVVGQVWYNSTEQKLKGLSENPTGSWATGGALNSARAGGGAVGTQTAALFFGGDGPSGKIALNESYNGSSWTEVGDLNATRGAGGATGIAPTTAAL